MNKTDINIKRLIWLYLFFLIFEGALRKWILPQYSSLLLIVRDPILLGIYALAMVRGFFPTNAFVVSVTVFAFLSFFTSFAGDGVLPITMFGLRANYLHLPLIFLMPKVMTLKDVKQMGFFLLLISPLMAALAVKQFNADANDWINAGTGGQIGGQLFATGKRVRPAGTFSFVNGMVSYLSVITAFLLFNFLEGKLYPKWLVVSSGVSLSFALAVSGSRSAVAAVTIVCLMVAIICLTNTAKFGRALLPLFLFYLTFYGLTNLAPVFNEALASQKTRFEESGGFKEGMLKRYFMEFPQAIDAGLNAPILGHGIGMGTNAAAGMLNEGRRSFMLAEGEWMRVVLELGPFLGFGYILLRVILAFYLLREAFRPLKRGHTAAFLLVGAVFLDVFTGQFGQPTALGFTVFIAGLVLAATRITEESEPKATATKLSTGKNPSIFGRSKYADQLHGPSSA